MGIPFATRGTLRRAGFLFLLLGGLSVVCWWSMIRMPGESHSGPLPPLTAGQAAVRDALRHDVEVLAGDIGERNVWRREALSRAADHIAAAFSAAGYEPVREGYRVGQVLCENIYAEILGPRGGQEIVVVGGHYDSAPGSPGANDNASGAAATLALARLFAGAKPERTLRFVAFVNEEPPYFQTPRMGSAFHARGMAERRETASAMLALETIGCYLDGVDSQRYPAPLAALYPSRGDFIAFVGSLSSSDLVRRTVDLFRRNAAFPSEGGALPGWMPGVEWSDHWAFGQEGWPALMVTDTAPFRYPHYHTPQDTPDKVDYERAARVTAGLVPVVAELARVPAPPVN